MLSGGLAASSIRKVHAVLSSAYEIEVKRGNVARNPCKLVEPPRLGQPEKAALSQPQARAVLDDVDSRRNAARWSVGLACGLRQGEALGLRWPSSTSTPASCVSGSSYSVSPGITAAWTSPLAQKGSTESRAPAGAPRRPASPAGRTSAFRKTHPGCARLAAPGTRRPARIAIAVA